MVIADLFIIAPNHGRVVRSVMGRVGFQGSALLMEASAAWGCKQAFVEAVVPQGRRAL